MVCNYHGGFEDLGAEAGDAGVTTEACGAMMRQASSAQALEDKADLWGALGDGPE